jgi:hypothetical protein
MYNTNQDVSDKRNGMRLPAANTTLLQANCVTMIWLLQDLGLATGGAAGRTPTGCSILPGRGSWSVTVQLMS